MKNFTLLITLAILFTACSTKSTTPLQCQNIQNEIDNLTKEKHRDLTAISIKALGGRYSYNGEEKYLNQKIKILELELSTCQKR